MTEQRTRDRDTIIDFLANTMRAVSIKQDAMIEDIATIKTQILAFPPYMKECNEERAEIKDYMEKSDLEKARHSGQISVFFALNSAIGAGVGFLISQWATIRGWI